MSSDSSSSEDEKERFREAVDLNFLTENLYDQSKTSETIPSKDVTQPSLRNQESKNAISINPLSVRVTPEFQKHVARHLTKILDELIEDTKLKKLKRKKRKEKSSGIKLLKNSKEFVTSLTPEIQQKPFKKQDSDTNEIELRAREVAVSGEWVLSQKETEHWAKSSKGEVEFVKSNKDKVI